MGPADPFAHRPPPVAAPTVPEAPPLPPRRLESLGFGVGALFGLLGLLVGFPQAGVVLVCGILGAVLGGLLQRRRVLLRWISEAAQRAA